MRLPLAYAVTDPVELDFDSFGAFLLDCVLEMQAEAALLYCRCARGVGATARAVLLLGSRGSCLLHPAWIRLVVVCWRGWLSDRCNDDLRTKEGQTRSVGFLYAHKPSAVLGNVQFVQRS